jgi:hypothetical protein
VRYLTSGEPERLGALLPELVGEKGTIGRVEWDNLRLRQ